jgi:site-specific recombinase XerD
VVRTPVRAKKPARRRGYSSIYPRQTQAGWKWRPAIRVEGDLVWGPSFDTQAQAYEALLGMRAEANVAPRTGGDLTLQESFDRAVQALLDKGGSEHTAKGYRHRIKRFSEILDPAAPVHQVTADDIRHLMRERRRLHQVTSNTLRWDLTLLRRVFKLAGLTGDRNPAACVERPDEKQPARPFLTMQKVGEMEATIRASGKPESEFHADLLVFLACTGIRSFEFSRLRTADFEFEPDGSGLIRVQGKRGGIREVALDAGLSDVARRLSSRCQTQPICPPSTIATILDRWADRLKVPHLNARILRRTFATDMAEHDQNLRLVQDQLGHKQLTTTQRYLGVRRDLLRDAAQRRLGRLRGG